jgi:putative membrane protein
MGFEWLKTGAFFGSIVYALLGVVVFWVCFVIIDKLTPYNLWDELVEKQNLALGMVVAAMCLGISIIVADPRLIWPPRSPTSCGSLSPEDQSDLGRHAGD